MEEKEVLNEEPATQEIKEVEKAPQYEEVKYQEVEIKPKQVETRTDSYFDGKVLELLGWKLLANLITGVTLGIAGPWAKCMLYRYEYGHTVFNGKRLKFEGNGGDLFVNRFKWYFFTLITLGIYGWWVPAKKQNWILNNLHFADEEFKPEESFFEEKGITLFWLNILCRFLNVITLGWAWSFTYCFKQRWIFSHSVINRKKLVFTGKGLNLLGNYLLWAFLTCITLGIYGWWVQVKKLNWRAMNVHIKRVGESPEEEKKEEKEKSKGKGILIAIPILLVGIIFFGVVIFIFTALLPGFSFQGIAYYSIKDTFEGWRYCEKGYAFSSDGEYCYKYKKVEYYDECEEGQRYFWYKGSHVCSTEVKPNEKYKGTSGNVKTMTEQLTIPESSRCPSGWEYDSYYNKCAKDIYTTYEDCTAQGGQAFGYNGCTIYTNAN